MLKDVLGGQASLKHTICQKWFIYQNKIYRKKVSGKKSDDFVGMHILENGD